jgi:hypothetical protein
MTLSINSFCDTKITLCFECQYAEWRFIYCSSKCHGPLEITSKQIGFKANLHAKKCNGTTFFFYILIDYRGHRIQFLMPLRSIYKKKLVSLNKNVF